MLRATRLSLAACLLGLAASASAVPVAGSSGGSFSHLGSCNQSDFFPNCRIVGSAQGPATQLQWGSTHLLRDFRNPSTLTAFDVAWNRGTPANDVVIARLDWYNSPTLDLRTPDDLSVRWNLAMGFTLPVGSIDPSASEAFNLSIVNVDNPTGDRLLGLTLSALDGLELSLAGVRLSDLKYSVSGGGSWLSGDMVWRNPENNLSTLLITADFAKVPEPGVLALIGLGALGLGAVRPRRRAAAGASAAAPSLAPRA